MGKMDVHFSSESVEWETPQELFDKLNAKFHFETDVCATSENAKCARYYTPEEDGLRQNWQGVCWMNPPYGREVGKWVRKAYDSALQGDATIVCLLPSRTDTAWWHDYVLRAKLEGFADIRFLRGRLKFVGSKNSAPFPSVLVFFGRRNEAADVL